MMPVDDAGPDLWLAPSRAQSMVLHKMEVNHVKSTFPMSLGARITGVDDCTFSSTGESFSSIVLPNAENNRVVDLQADDVSLAYEVRCRALHCCSCTVCGHG